MGQKRDQAIAGQIAIAINLRAMSTESGRKY
jgi:hypothetical protein